MRSGAKAVAECKKLLLAEMEQRTALEIISADLNWFCQVAASARLRGFSPGGRRSDCCSMAALSWRLATAVTDDSKL